MFYYFQRLFYHSIMAKDNSIRFSLPATNDELVAAQDIVSLHAAGTDARALAQDIARLTKAAEKHRNKDPHGADAMASLGRIASENLGDIKQ